MRLDNPRYEALMSSHGLQWFLVIISCEWDVQPQEWRLDSIGHLGRHAVPDQRY